MFHHEIDGLKSIITSRLTVYIGPLAHVIVSEAIASLAVGKETRLSTPHLVSVLRQIHASLPPSVDRNKIVSELRTELLSNKI